MTNGKCQMILERVNILEPQTFTAAPVSSQATTSISIGPVVIAPNTFWPKYSVLIESAEDDSYWATLADQTATTFTTAADLTPVTLYKFTLTPFCDDAAGDAFMVQNVITSNLPRLYKIL